MYREIMEINGKIEENKDTIRELQNENHYLQGEMVDKIVQAGRVELLKVDFAKLRRYYRANR